MAIYEAEYTWSLTSSGAGGVFGRGSTVAGANTDALLNCARVTVYVNYGVSGATASTAVFGIETAANATSVFGRVGSTAYSLSSNGDAAVIQLPGPLGAVRPFLIARDAATTTLNVTLMGNA